MSNHPRPFIYVIMLVLLEEIAVIKFCINIMDMTRKKKILYVFFYMQCSLIRVSYWDSSYASCKCFFWLGYTYIHPSSPPLLAAWKTTFLISIPERPKFKLKILEIWIECLRCIYSVLIVVIWPWTIKPIQHDISNFRLLLLMQKRLCINRSSNFAFFLCIYCLDNIYISELRISLVNYAWLIEHFMIDWLMDWLLKVQRHI